MSGSFEVFGDGRHDARVIITDQQGFMNFQNHTGFLQWFDSGKVKVGRVNANLAAGNYVLIISNTHSVLSDAPMTAAIYVTQFSE